MGRQAAREGAAVAAMTVGQYTADGRDWDEFVRGRPGATFCHLSAWRDVIGGVMGQEPVFLRALTDEGVLSGVLPLFHLRSRLFGNRLVSVPFLNYGGPLGDAPAERALLASAVEEARSRGASLEVRARHTVDADLDRSERKVTVVLPLPSDPEVLWNGLRAKLRSQIRRPRKEGMVTHFGADRLAEFYDVFATNMRDLGTPVLPLAFFTRIAEVFPDEFVVAVVHTSDGRPVAAGAGFLFDGEFEISWASALREWSSSAPNMLLYWSLMEETIRRGASAFNFGRCTPGEGTHRFKQQWGGVDEPLPWLEWPAAAPGAGPGKAVRLASATWQRLPLPIANAVGPLVARRLPWW